MFTVASIYWMLWVLKISYSDAFVLISIFAVTAGSGEPKFKTEKKVTVIYLLSFDVTLVKLLFDIDIGILVLISDVWLTVHRNSVWIRKTN